MFFEELSPILYGFVGGLLAGLLGIGGGAIYILILSTTLANAGVCDSDIVKFTIANSVFAIFTASLSGNILNLKNGYFYGRDIFRIGIPSSIFSILTMILVVNQPWYSKNVFNIFVIFLLAFMLVKMLMKKNIVDEDQETTTGKLGFIGFLAGIISALSGLGGGVLVVPMLQNFFQTPIKKAKNISLGVVGVMAFSLSVYNLFFAEGCKSNEFQIGLIVFPTVLLMIVGVVLGSPIGVWVSNKIKPDYIKIIFAILLISVITKKIFEVI